jgi:hypothetical protein
MLRFFIYDTNEKLWKEEDIILFHDIVSILDEDEKILYYWQGPKAEKKKKAEAKTVFNQLLKSLDLDLEVHLSEENLPQKIQRKLEQKLKITQKSEAAEKYKFTRFSTIRVYLVFLIILNILGIISMINLFSLLILNLNGDNIIVSSQFYTEWLFRYRIIMIIILIFLILSILIGIYERDYQVISFSTIGLITSVGILFLLNQGIFLFLFQPGSTETFYYISSLDVTLFIFMNSLGLIMIIIPHIYELIHFIITYRKFIF